MRAKSPLAVIFLTICLDLIGFAMVVPLLPLYAQRFAVSPAQVTFLFAGYSLMQFLCAPFWGRLSDRVGRRPVLLGSIAATAGSLAIYAAAPNYAVLLMGRLLAGACTANIAVAQAYVGDVTSPQNRARGMGMVGAAFGLGFVVGPFIGGEMSQFGLAAPAWLACSLSACNWLLAYAYLPESLSLGSRAQGHVGLSLAQRWAALRSGQLPGRPMGLLFLQQAGFSMMEVAIVLFVRSRLGLDAMGVGRMFAGIGIVLALVQGVGVGRLTQRFGEVPLVRIGLGLSAAGMWLTPATSAAAPAVLAAALCLMTVGHGLVGPCLSALVSRQAPPTQQGSVLAVAQSLSSLARVVGPQAAGMALARGNENWPFWLGGAVIGSAALLSVMRLSGPAAPQPQAT